MLAYPQSYQQIQSLYPHFVDKACFMYRNLLYFHEEIGETTPLETVIERLITGSERYGNKKMGCG